MIVYMTLKVILAGSLYDCVDVEECCWSLERSGGCPPRLELQLLLKKLRESQGRNHWRCVVRCLGDDAKRGLDIFVSFCL